MNDKKKRNLKRIIFLSSFVAVCLEIYLFLFLSPSVFM